MPTISYDVHTIPQDIMYVGGIYKASTAFNCYYFSVTTAHSANWTLRRSERLTYVFMFEWKKQLGNIDFIPSYCKHNNNKQ